MKKIPWHLLPLLEGVLAFFLLLLPPSESGSARFWGYSLSRLALAGAFLLTLLLLAAFTLWAQRHPLWTKARLAALDAWLQDDTRLLSLGVWLLIFLVGAVLVPLLYRPAANFLFQHTYTFFVYDYALRAARIFGVIEMLFLRALPVLAWVWLQSLQVFIWLVCRFAHRFRQPGFFRTAVLGNNLLLLSLLLGAGFQFLLLYLHLDFLQYIDGWFWKFYDRPIQNAWLFPLLVALSLLALWLVLRFRRHVAFNLLLLFLLGCALQWGFGRMENRAGVRGVYAERGRLAYPARVCRGVALADILFRYETVHEDNMYFDTKPPGTLLVYALVGKLANALLPGVDCFTAVLRIIPWLFIPLAFASLPLLEYLARPTLGEDSLLAPFVLLFFPNFILIPLELDGALFPVFTLLALVCLLKALKHGQAGWALASGALIFLGVYLSFALLPVLALCLGWLALEAYRSLRQKDSPGWKIHLRLAAHLLAGFIGLGLLFYLALQYDPLQRYAAAMAAHRAAKEYGQGWTQLSAALLLNNAEFFTWIGIPYALLLLSSLFRSARAWLKGSASTADSLLAALLGVFLLLNIVGQTRGEVARLWLFLVPLCSLFIARRMAGLTPRKGIGLTLVMVWQLLITFLLFAYQDLG